MEFRLEVIGEAIAQRGVDPPDIVTPLFPLIFIPDRAEKLLVPTQRAVKLRGDFVFRFEVIGKGVGVADVRDLEARFKKFRPKLKVMPREGNVLRQDELAIIAEPATRRKTRCGYGTKVRASTGGEAQVPHFIGPKSDPAAKCRVFETTFSNAPGLWPRSERGIFYFRGIIEPAATPRERDTARVARTPDHGKAPIFIGVIAVVVFAHMSPIQKGLGFVRCSAIPNAGQIFIGERPVNERILPGVVPRDPIADDGRKLSDLEVDVPGWSVAKKIFVEPASGAAIARIEAAVHPRLRKEIKVRGNLEVEEKRQPRIEKKIVLGKNETRRWLVDRIRFEIGKTAELEMETVLRIAER